MRGLFFVLFCNVMFWTGCIALVSLAWDWPPVWTIITFVALSALSIIVGSLCMISGMTSHD